MISKDSGIRDYNNRSSIDRPVLWTKDFILICLVNLSIFMGFQMLMPTFGPYIKTIGGNDTMAGLITGIFSISAVAIRPIAGKALDTYGRRLLFIFGLAIFVISVLSYVLANTIALLLIMRLIHGIGWGISSTASSTIASDIIPKKRLGEGMAYYGLASTIAMAIAPALGLYIISSVSFELNFIISAALALLALLLAIMIKYSPFKRDGNVKPVLFERSAFAPSAVVFFVTMTYGAIVSFIALYAAQKGIANAGLFFTIYAMSLAVTRPIAGPLADRRGFNAVVIPGIVMVLIAMILLSVMDSMALFIVAAALYGIGFGSVQPSLQAISVKNVASARRGAANGTFFSAFDIGIGVGSILWGAVANSLGYDHMYLIAAIPALIALPLYILLLGRNERQHS